jgi:hypothetical protein
MLIGASTILAPPFEEGCGIRTSRQGRTCHQMQVICFASQTLFANEETWHALHAKW